MAGKNPVRSALPMPLLSCYDCVARRGSRMVQDRGKSKKRLTKIKHWCILSASKDALQRVQRGCCFWTLCAFFIFSEFGGTAVCQQPGVRCHSQQCSLVKTVPSVCPLALICTRCVPQLLPPQAFYSSEPASLRRFLSLCLCLVLYFLRALWRLSASPLAALPG